MNDAAGCDGDISLSLRLVITGYIEEMGGPLQLGKELGQLQRDPEVSPAARVSLANAMTRLMGRYGDDTEDEPELIDEEQLNRVQKAIG